MAPPGDAGAPPPGNTAKHAGMPPDAHLQGTTMHTQTLATAPARPSAAVTAGALAGVVLFAALHL